MLLTFSAEVSDVGMLITPGTTFEIVFEESLLSELPINGLNEPPLPEPPDVPGIPEGPFTVPPPEPPLNLPI